MAGRRVADRVSDRDVKKLRVRCRVVEVRWLKLRPRLCLNLSGLGKTRGGCKQQVA